MEYMGVIMNKKLFSIRGFYLLFLISAMGSCFAMQRSIIQLGRPIARRLGQPSAISHNSLPIFSQQPLLPVVAIQRVPRDQQQFQGVSKPSKLITQTRQSESSVAQALSGYLKKAPTEKESQLLSSSRDKALVIHKDSTKPIRVFEWLKGHIDKRVSFNSQLAELCQSDLKQGIKVNIRKLIKNACKTVPGQKHIELKKFLNKVLGIRLPKELHTEAKTFHINFDQAVECIQELADQNISSAGSSFSLDQLTNVLHRCVIPNEGSLVSIRQPKIEKQALVSHVLPQQQNQQIALVSDHDTQHGLVPFQNEELIAEQMGQQCQIIDGKYYVDMAFVRNQLQNVFSGQRSASLADVANALNMRLSDQQYKQLQVWKIDFIALSDHIRNLERQYLGQPLALNQAQDDSGGAEQATMLLSVDKFLVALKQAIKPTDFHLTQSHQQRFLAAGHVSLPVNDLQAISVPSEVIRQQEEHYQQNDDSFSRGDQREQVDLIERVSDYIQEPTRRHEENKEEESRHPQQEQDSKESLNQGQRNDSGQGDGQQEDANNRADREKSRGNSRLESSSINQSNEQFTLPDNPYRDEDFNDQNDQLDSTSYQAEKKKKRIVPLNFKNQVVSSNGPEFESLVNQKVEPNLQPMPLSLQAQPLTQSVAPVVQQRVVPATQLSPNKVPQRVISNRLPNDAKGTTALANKQQPSQFASSGKWKSEPMQFSEGITYATPAWHYQSKRPDGYIVDRPLYVAPRAQVTDMSSPTNVSASMLAAEARDDSDVLDLKIAHKPCEKSWKEYSNATMVGMPKAKPNTLDTVSPSTLPARKLTSYVPVVHEKIGSYADQYDHATSDDRQHQAPFWLWGCLCGGLPAAVTVTVGRARIWLSLIKKLLDNIL